MVALPENLISVLRNGSEWFLAIAYELANGHVGEHVPVREIIREWPAHLFGSNYSPSFYVKSKKEKWVLPERTISGFIVVTKTGEDHLFSLKGEERPFVSKGPGNFVDQRRLNELRALTLPEHDLTRLVRMCEELEDNFSRSNYISSILLVRSILDHSAPLFGFTTFTEVANNLKCERSIKESLAHLENSSRKIADGHLHIPIRSKEGVPTRTQVNFSQDMDVLLGEIVRKFK